jgi:hypothetical protein
MIQDNFNCERILMSKPDLETSQIKFKNKTIVKVSVCSKSLILLRQVSLVTDVFLNKSDFFGRPSENVSKRFHALLPALQSVDSRQRM